MRTDSRRIEFQKNMNYKADAEMEGIETSRKNIANDHAKYLKKLMDYSCNRLGTQ